MEAHRNHLEELVENRTEELKASQAQMVHMEKLSALGKLTGSISHEFNNPLQGIKGILEALKESNVTGNHIKILKIAEKEVDRMAKMIRGLREFYRPSPGIACHTDINNCLKEVLQLQMTVLRQKGIKVKEILSDKTPCLEVVEDQIKQVLLNLIQNAAESISGEGQITVISELKENYVIIKIQDTGSGISEDVKSKLYEPFYTTKDDEQGTGLGLSVSYGIIRDHGGEIEVESEFGKGTIFTVKLPA
ncbi:MAG: ATP-binding protein [Nitrospinota bacterium]